MTTTINRRLFLLGGSLAALFIGFKPGPKPPKPPRTTTTTSSPTTGGYGVGKYGSMPYGGS